MTQEELKAPLPAPALHAGERGPGSDAPDKPPPGTAVMAILRWLLVAVMAIVAGASVAYSFGLLGGDAASAASARYHCPMHPQIVRDAPGDCPICGMSLVPREREREPAPERAAPREGSHAGHRHEPTDPFLCPMHPEETGLSAEARCPICRMKLEPRKAEPAPAPQESAERALPGLAPIALDFDRVQLIGVRTATAELGALTPELRTVGFVTPDEARTTRVHARFAGWIETLEVATSGQKVRRGQVLARIFTPELLPAQQELIAAARWKQTAGAPPAGAGAGSLGNLESGARTRLSLLGMSAEEIDRVAKSGELIRSVELRAPIAGTVTAKAALQGTFVQPGAVLFEITDLSRLWVIADVYESEIARVERGLVAEVSFGAHPGQRFGGKVAFTYPALDPQTRTLPVRIEVDASRGLLLPGMYGEVTIQLPPMQGITIPREALIDTGNHQYVFIARDDHVFEPRAVTPGTRNGERIQILSGVSAGERVVTTGNFLLDSESRLRSAIAGSAR